MIREVRGGTSSQSSQPIRFAGSVLDAKRHVWRFFHSPTKNTGCCSVHQEGFERARRHSTSSIPSLYGARPATRVGRIDVEAAEKSGQFELRNWADAYLRDGHFDQDRMLALIQEVLDGGIEQGFALTRLAPYGMGP